MSKMKTIQVTIDEDLLQKLDQAIADLQTTRSTFLHLALKKALRKHHIRQLEELDEVGYTAVPATASDVEEWETEQAWGDEVLGN